MRICFQLFVILGVLLAFGAAKLRYEDKLARDMVEAKLIKPPLEKGTSLKLGQTGAAVALGGLRSLIAAVWNLKAFNHFENLEWLKLEESYKTITALQPQTIYYWQTGAWHLHTNASVSHKENNKLPAFRQKSLQQLYIKKGSAFLEEGIRQNPESWRLHIELSRLWTDRHKLPDYPRGAQYYRDTLACDTLPEFKRKQIQRFIFYTMCNIPEQYAEALAEGSKLFHATEDNHTPNLVCSIFALQNELKTPIVARIPDDQLFPDKKRQLTWLKNFWRNQTPTSPTAGVQTKIDELEQRASF